MGSERLLKGGVMVFTKLLDAELLKKQHQVEDKAIEEARERVGKRLQYFFSQPIKIVSMPTEQYEWDASWVEARRRETDPALTFQATVPCPADAPHDGCVLCKGFGYVEELKR